MSLSDRIAEELSDRINAREDLPEPFSIANVARLFDVSASPVRTAFDQLVEEGLLIRDESGRLTPNPGRKPKRRTNRSDAHEPSLEVRIREFIIRRSLAGNDSFLREEATAEHFGISRTVLRHWLGKLAGQGFVEHVQRRGWRSRLFLPQDLEHYSEVRETLELLALRDVRENLDPEMLKSILAGNQPLPDGTPQLDNRLHAYWINLSGNYYIRDFFDRHGVFHAAIFDLATTETSAVAEMAEQHRVILESLLEKNWKKAEAVLSKHIRSQIPRVERMLEEIRSEGKKGPAE
ncbi:GntR family transcriptional regulator [Blastopirellula sp. JC732]|uniref:GntR family transcriptional regulator n=1 Tax=Blastopirellula sediminis TaxID=2894196 RepID=A0A9X1SEU6_9BACT|nr:GntR family transcriptional regulator [Blastopirellula sediminis]MCC9608908.1 GntR family transcriptional regulator [Blastopirellula sediminis]MCC9628315.1 GntR family transcriptional regulator [Blastopirellula sediminis]